jgi:hypothetical protein
VQSRIVPKREVHLVVYHGLDRCAAIEFATNLMGSGDETRQVIDGGNLFLFEQRHKLILLAWVGACRASANNCGGQHHQGVNHSIRKADDSGAHGSVSPRGVDLTHEQKVTALYAPGLRAAAVGGVPGKAQQWGAQHRWLGQYV